MHSTPRSTHYGDHVENPHLSKAVKLVLNNVNHFKHHVVAVHGINLRQRVFPGYRVISFWFKYGVISSSFASNHSHYMGTRYRVQNWAQDKLTRRNPVLALATG